MKPYLGKIKRNNLVCHQGSKHLLMEKEDSRWKEEMEGDEIKEIPTMLTSQTSNLHSSHCNLRRGRKGRATALTKERLLARNESPPELTHPDLLG
jgi:hypothetical protein